MIELQIAKAKQEIDTTYEAVIKSIENFEKNPTKYNRSAMHNKIQALRKNLTIFKNYTAGLYLKM